MRTQRVPLPLAQTEGEEKQFTGSLIRRVLVVLLLTTLIPLLLIGTLNHFRSRDMLRQQMQRQLDHIAERQAKSLVDFAAATNEAIFRLTSDPQFTARLQSLLRNPKGSEEYDLASSYFFDNFQLTEQPYAGADANRMFILNASREVVFTTDDDWTAEYLTREMLTDPEFQQLSEANQSRLAFNPSGDSNQLGLITSRSILDESGAPLGTLFTVTTSNIFTDALINIQSSFSTAESYYFTGSTVIGLDNPSKFILMPHEDQLVSTLNSLVGNLPNRLSFSTRSFEGSRAIAFAEWIPAYNFGILITVTEAAVFGAGEFLDPFNIAILFISLAAAGSLFYLSSTRLVKPLTQLAQTAGSFSNGNWEEQADANRHDEIGMLAQSLNSMAGELKDLHASLEGAVTKRTGQLRIASEVAQLATSTTSFTETITRTVDLINERFGCYHVSLFLIDESGQSLTCKEASGTASAQVKRRGEQVQVDDSTLVGWAAANNRPRQVSSTGEDALFYQDELLPDTRSEVAVPISIGSEILGVLDIHSSVENAFDDEVVSIFMTLANQISSTLQNTRLLETTQVSYQETSLLYRATRRVIQSEDESEILQTLIDTFLELPYLCSILSVKDEAHFKIHAVTDPRQGHVETMQQIYNIPAGRTLALLADQRSILVGDLLQPSEYANILTFFLRRGCKSAAIIPVMENRKLSKVIALGAYEKNQFSAINIQPYTNLADVISATLEKHYIVGSLRQRLVELQILARFSQAVSAEIDLTNLYRVLHEQVIQTFGPELGFGIALYNAHDNLIDFPYLFENGELLHLSPLNLGEGLTSKLITEKRPFALNSQQAILESNVVLDGELPKSWMGIPLLLSGEVIGAIILQEMQQENRFQQNDINLFMTLAPQIAIAIRNTQLYTETQQALRNYDEEHFLINTLLDNIPDSVSFKDTRGRFIRASASFARSYNTTPEALIGKTEYDLMSHDAADKIFHSDQAVMNLRKPQIGITERLVSETGEETWVHSSRIPIHTASGDPYGLLIILRDVTGLKQAESLSHRRAEQVLTAAEITRDTTGTLDINELLQKSVNLVRERFGYYHASIFLLDDSGEYAVLRQSTGQAGQQMMQAGHRLGIGSKSIVGQVTASGKPLIVNDVTNDPNHFPNPLLPDTRSEMALPLKTGSRILGAIDVQSTQTGAFIDEDISVLQILADQLAVALVNAELFARTQDLLNKHRLLRQITILTSASPGLEDALSHVVGSLNQAKIGDQISVLLMNDTGQLQMRTSAGYQGNRHMELSVSPGQGIIGTAAEEKRAIRVDDTRSDPRYVEFEPEIRSELAVPILFGDELIGVLNLESKRTAAFDENDQEILSALGNNLGGVIANLRLVNQVRQQIARERQMFEVTSKIRRSVDLESIMETSTSEICRVLGARRATIQITAGRDPHQSSKSDNGTNQHQKGDLE